MRITDEQGNDTGLGWAIGLFALVLLGLMGCIVAMLPNAV